jgi:predicted dehydrogenase
MKKLQAAIIGVGFVGRAHLEALRRRGIPVVGLLGSSPERTKEACSSLGIERAYSSLEGSHLHAEPSSF